MTYQELLNKWQKDGTYPEELTFICHCVRTGYKFETIAQFYALTPEEFKEMAKADPMVDLALKKKNIVGRKEFVHECRKYAYGFYKKEPREEDYVDSDGKQKKRIVYIDKFVAGNQKDREYYGKKFIDKDLGDEIEVYELKGDLKEKGKVKCLKPGNAKASAIFIQKHGKKAFEKAIKGLLGKEKSYYAIMMEAGDEEAQIKLLEEVLKQ